MSPSRIGAAVIGLGVGEQHARAYASDPRVELRWVHDLDRRRAEALARELHAQVADGIDTILLDPAVSILSIASYDQDHAAQVIGGLEARRHCFVEKPLCRSADELLEIVRRWEAAGRPVLRSNLVLRAAPLFAWLKDAIAGGELGEVYAFDGDYLYGRLSKITEGWRSNVIDYSVMAGGGIHLIDLMLWLTGERPSRVSAVGGRVVTRGTAFRYDDLACATFTFPSGLVGRISANFGVVHRHQHVVRVFGTRATFISDDQGARLHTGRDGADHVEPISLPSLPATKGVLIPAFVDAVLRGSDSATTHEFDLVRATIAADTARSSGQEVEVSRA